MVSDEAVNPATGEPWKVGDIYPQNGLPLTERDIDVLNGRTPKAAPEPAPTPTSAPAPPKAPSEAVERESQNKARDR